MTPSQNCLQMIAEFEGFRATPYSDIANNPTIGFGHKILQTEYFDSVTRSQATDMLTEDACQAGKCVDCVVTIDLNQNQFDALVDFVYNLGIGNLEKSTLLKLLNSGDYNGAAQEFTKWDMAGGKISDGLLRRRQAEQNLFMKG